MPQMAPMNWLILFIFFMSMFYLTMNIIYFMFIKNKKSYKINLNKSKNYNKFI
uniref:F-ATPase subunit 8 n=2 Tax=Paracletus TaxID=223033 RepID=B5WYX5_9HEMI|nr:F-ATPase subunit 8 [Paracletus donisthorpei]CAQ52865.1 F-ATPase subunit 8 [Paracletus cimiciformis]CAQ52868.1 F-ATPase subunit 8 [Paracletus cimiciformis]CAQ52871.1 F-ATPase subunit 8 [Paracletus cimiciformis]